MAITTRVRTQTTIDRIRATPAHGALNPRAGQTGELTHIEIDTIGAASLAITASLNMEQVLATVAERAVDSFAPQPAWSTCSIAAPVCCTSLAALTSPPRITA